MKIYYRIAFLCLTLGYPSNMSVLQAEFQQDFRGGKFDQGTLRLVGSGECLKSSEVGLQITIKSGSENAGVPIVLPPNSNKCSENLHDHTRGVFTAGSRHQGGCHVAMVDGSVNFISESIDTGDLAVPSIKTLSGPSPYGVWGAMGTRASNETIETTSAPGNNE